MYIDYILPLVGHHTLPSFQHINKTRTSRDVVIGNPAGVRTTDEVDIPMGVQRNEEFHP